VRYVNRYDVENVVDDVCKKQLQQEFSPNRRVILSPLRRLMCLPATLKLFGNFYPGQYDQRADSAEQCLFFVGEKECHTRNKSWR